MQYRIPSQKILIITPKLIYKTTNQNPRFLTNPIHYSRVHQDTNLIDESRPFLSLNFKFVKITNLFPAQNRLPIALEKKMNV